MLLRRLASENSLSPSSGGLWEALVEGDSKRVVELVSTDPGALCSTCKTISSVLALHPRVKSDLAQMFAFDLTPLSVCILRDDLAMCRTLIELGARVNAVCHRTIPPLHLCAYTGNTLILGILLASGADARIAFRGLLPLHVSIIHGRRDAAVFLLGRFPEMASRPTADVEERTPLILAAIHGRAEILDLLLSSEGVDEDAPDRLNTTALHHVLKARNFVYAFRILEVIAKRGREPRRTSMGETYLHLAARGGVSTETFRAMLSLFPESERENARTANGRNVLTYAADGHNFKLCAWLLERGAAYRADDRGVTPMHLAAVSRDPQTCIELLRHGVPISPRDQMGRTPLFFATENGCFETCKHLLNAGAAQDVDIPCKATGSTPLMKAVQKRDRRIAKLLLGYGADAGRRNAFGMGSIHCAVTTEQPDVVRLMIKRRPSLLNVMTSDAMLPANLCKSPEMKEILFRAAAAVAAEKPGQQQG